MTVLQEKQKKLKELIQRLSDIKDVCISYFECDDEGFFMTKNDDFAAAIRGTYAGLIPFAINTCNDGTLEVIGIVLQRIEGDIEELRTELVMHIADRAEGFVEFANNVLKQRTRLKLTGKDQACMEKFQKISQKINIYNLNIQDGTLQTQDKLIQAEKDLNDFVESYKAFMSIYTKCNSSYPKVIEKLKNKVITVLRQELARADSGIKKFAAKTDGNDPVEQASQVFTQMMKAKIEKSLPPPSSLDKRRAAQRRAKAINKPTPEQQRESKAEEARQAARRQEVTRQVEAAKAEAKRIERESRAKFVDEIGYDPARITETAPAELGITRQTPAGIAASGEAVAAPAPAPAEGRAIETSTFYYENLAITRVGNAVAAYILDEKAMASSAASFKVSLKKFTENLCSVYIEQFTGCNSNVFSLRINADSRILGKSRPCALDRLALLINNVLPEGDVRGQGLQFADNPCYNVSVVLFNTPSQHSILNDDIKIVNKQASSLLEDWIDTLVVGSMEPVAAPAVAGPSTVSAGASVGGHAARVDQSRSAKRRGR